MLIGIKDAAKLIGISIIACCAVLICAMFVNYYIDLLQIEDLAVSEQAGFLYRAQAANAKVVCFVSGGCLLLTAVVMLLFYIRQYIDTHKKELGILKALGYSNLRIARHFWVFGFGVLTGTSLGFLGALLLMPSFYETQNQDHILPEVSIRFHAAVPFCFVLLPTVVFSALSILYACLCLRRPVLSLLKNDLWSYGRRRSPSGRRSGPDDGGPFLGGLRRHTLRTKKTLTFFIAFSSFCFSCTTQMAASMDELASAMMGMMILLIGMTLACTTLILAITTVVNGNTKTIALMHMTGYFPQECRSALLDGYRPVSYLGFAAGTAYQYFLLRVMVDIVFGEIAEGLTYEFDVPAMLCSLVCFVVVYEALMYVFASRIRRISTKELMS